MLVTLRLEIELVVPTAQRRRQIVSASTPTADVAPDVPGGSSVPIAEV
jgi:hypothetical protein